jgi:murein L,D-transpeptidase YafK
MEFNSRSRWIVAVFVAASVIGLCVTCYLSMSGGLGGGAEAGAPENHRMSLVNPRIVVSKDERQLRLYSGEKIVRSYRIGLGPCPVGHKLNEGDGRTPEGQYYVCTKNAKSRYYLSLGLSYPNIGDAERGLREGVITRRQYEAIAGAVRAGKTPLWNTPLGGEIFIHGNGAGSDWTLGCIALDNRDMRELYETVEVGFVWVRFLDSENAVLPS